MAVPSGKRGAAVLAGGAALVLAGGFAVAALAHPSRTADSPAPRARAVLDSCTEGEGGARQLHRGRRAAVHVDLRAAPCSQQQLLAGQQAVVRASRGLQSRLGVVVQTVSSGTDGRGLTVDYSLSGNRADPGSAAVLAALRSLVRVPVLTAERGEGAAAATGLGG